MVNKLLLRGGVLILLALVICVFAAGRGFALEKIKMGSPVKTNPQVALPFLAAEAKGFWTKQGLEVDWRPFRSGGAVARAVAARAINLGTTVVVWGIRSISRGIPMVLVGDLNQSLGWAIWVRIESPLKKIRQLKGTKVGITRTGSGTHAFGTALAQTLGLEKDIQFVATGGVPQLLAALKAQAVDGIVLTKMVMIKLVAKGQARKLVGMDEYLPKPWVSRAMFATPEYIKEKPNTVRRMIRGMRSAHQFIGTDQSWSTKKLMAEYGYSQKLAEQVYKAVNWQTTMRINRAAVQNVADFLVKYRLAKKEEIPPLNQLFTNRFVD